MLRVYIYRHKIHREEGFTQEGPREVKLIMNRIKPLIIAIIQTLVFIIHYSYTNIFLD